ncbi:hypothetical protein K438DRAFT_1755721 [Mycena galopus ATCC 62051]|nr:hypothetical protein K438DRAFT_1755721 [Mycena galopus ATCC 62051]
MEEELELKWLHVLQLQKRESQLLLLVVRLNVISEVFESAAAVEEQPVPGTPDPSNVLSIPHIFGGTGGPGGAGGGKGGAGGAGGSRHGPSFQAGNNITINNCLPEHERLEQSNIRLDTEVRVLHTDVHDLYAEVHVLHSEVRSLDNQYLAGTSADERMRYSPSSLVQILERYDPGWARVGFHVYQPVIIPGARWRSAGSQLDIPVEIPASRQLDVHVMATLSGLLQVHQEMSLLPANTMTTHLKAASILYYITHLTAYSG